MAPSHLLPILLTMAAVAAYIPHPTHAGEPPQPPSTTITWSTCPPPIQAYFLSVFPQWKGENVTTNNHNAHSTAQDFLFHERFSNVNGNPRTTIIPPSPEFLAESYQNALAIASGCTSCANGCCDVSNILFDCGTQIVPYDYDNPTTGSTFQQAVYRIRLVGPLAPLNSANRKAYWILQGGPGASGLTILFLSVPSLRYATDIYVPDHRGTGYSSVLNCPQIKNDDIAASLTVACVKASNKVGNPPVKFTVTGAARDLGRLVLEVKTTTKPQMTIVHGASYGTRWAQRFLQIFPALADRVILEGVVAKDTVFNDYVLGSQTAGDRFMQKCGESSLCTAYISTIQNLITTIFKAGKTNQCSLLLFNGKAPSYDELLSQVQNQLLNSLQLGLQQAADDSFVDLQVFVAGYTWILSLNGGLTQATIPSPTVAPIRTDSALLYYQVAFSELWRYPIESSQAVYDARFANVYWGPPYPWPVYTAYSAVWYPLRSPAEPMYQNHAPQNVVSHLLIVNGELDGQTPRYQAWETFYNITMASPSSLKFITNTQDTGHYSSWSKCGISAITAFTSTATPKGVSCGIPQFGPTPPLASGFTIPTDYSVVLSGAEDVWIGGISPQFCSTPITRERSAIRCLDYCVLIQQTDLCGCLTALALQLAELNVETYESTCKSWQARYFTTLKLKEFNPKGSCANACKVTLSPSLAPTLGLPSCNTFKTKSACGVGGSCHWVVGKKSKKGQCVDVVG